MQSVPVVTVDSVTKVRTGQVFTRQINSHPDCSSGRTDTAVSLGIASTVEVPAATVPGQLRLVGEDPAIFFGPDAASSMSLHNGTMRLVSPRVSVHGAVKADSVTLDDGQDVMDLLRALTDRVIQLQIRYAQLQTHVQSYSNGGGA
jgi:hypothetical protein